MTTTTETTTKIGKGTRFNATYQDGNPEWEITKSRGRGVFEARIVDERCFGAVTKVFTTEEVRRAVAMANYFTKSRDESQDFYDALPLGQTVHYHNGFGQFVRCVVVDACITGFKKERCLMPVALVGKWDQHDLPRRRSNGEIHYGYHADKIRNQTPFKPNASFLYEKGSDSVTRFGNPSVMPAIDLTVPEMTAEEQATAALWTKIHAIQNIATHGTDPAAILEAIRTTLG